MTRTVAFHSYKGGTGKSTIAANLAAKLATNGYNVAPRINNLQLFLYTKSEETIS